MGQLQGYETEPRPATVITYWRAPKGQRRSRRPGRRSRRRPPPSLCGVRLHRATSPPAAAADRSSDRCESPVRIPNG
eukprot:scaffold52966_cov45-Phaeocystis_antarctica.AAC.1